MKLVCSYCKTAELLRRLQIHSMIPCSTERRERQRGKKSQVCATGSVSPECEKTEGARKHEGRECRVLYLTNIMYVGAMA